MIAPDRDQPRPGLPWLFLLAVATAAGCVDLSPPPELSVSGADTGAGSGGAGGGGGSGGGTGEDAAGGGTAPDSGAGTPDGPRPGDGTSAPDRGPDAAAVPDAAAGGAGGSGGRGGGGGGIDGGGSGGGGSGGGGRGGSGGSGGGGGSPGPDAAAPQPDVSPPPDSAPDLAPPPDAGPPPASLVVDDFEDGEMTVNRVGGAVAFENQSGAAVAGEGRFVWNGLGTTHALLEGLRTDFCSQDLTGYSKLTFKVRSSVAGKRLAVHLMVGPGACRSGDNIRMTTITTSTVMTTHEVDMTRTVRNQGQALVFAPTTADMTEYFLDDVVLVP